MLPLIIHEIGHHFGLSDFDMDWIENKFEEGLLFKDFQFHKNAPQAPGQLFAWDHTFSPSNINSETAVP